MRKHLNVPKKDRMMGEATLWVGAGAIAALFILGVLAKWGYISISLPY